MKIVKWSGSLFLLCLAWSSSILAQTVPAFENSHYRYSTKTAPLTTAVTPAKTTSSVALPTSFTYDVVMPPELIVPERKIKDASVFIKVNLGDDYKYGPHSAVDDNPLNFKYKIAFNLKCFNGTAIIPGVFEQTRYELTIENGKPEALYVKNIAQYSDIGNNAVSASDFKFQRIAIDQVTITPLLTATSASTPQASMLAIIANSIRFEISYDIEYGIHAGIPVSQPVLTSLGATKQISKQLTFQWNNSGYQFPNYEFQLLRLFNSSAGTAVSETDITADIDWSQALKIETQSSKTSLSLTMAEGTGFYVWRVRPLGNFYEGGIANDLNYTESNWSVNPGNAMGVRLGFADANGVTYSGPDASAYFYYEDIAADKNWIYSRVFTEENKVSENITYATPLLQSRQTQAYSSSKDKTLVTQTVPDNSGRPALSTLPVPVTGKIGDYKPNFVQKAGSQAPYKAQDYDDDSNYREPSKINQDQTPLGYYSNQNPDLNIPDAEGYPFQRTLFYNDGTQRVQEQSGVGKMHMIGDGNGSDGKGAGKTTRTLYGTASETELVALFGDEAPSHETVLKTINIDANNTASISYTSKEGNVIATALSFQDSENDPNKPDKKSPLDPLPNEGSAGAMRTVKDPIRKSVLSERGFTSSKRIALLQETPMDFAYKVKCQELENNCLDLQLNCKYKVKIIIHSVERPTESVELNTIDLTNTPCTADANGVEYKSVSWPRQQLTAGTYIIEKKLEAGDPEIDVENKKKAEAQVMPLINKITGMLADVDCEEMLQAFYDNLTTLANDVNNSFAAGTSCDAACVIAKHGLGNQILTAEHKIQIANNSTTGRPEKLLLTSPCCGTMAVSVVYIPPFRCPAVVEMKNGSEGKPDNGRPDVNLDFFGRPQDTEFFPDFEGYALALLKDCNVTPAVFYSKYMTGWANSGDFNKMVYHMLTDRYNAKGLASVEGGVDENPAPPVATTDDCGNAVVNTGIQCDPGTNNCTQYTCAQLINCWTQQIVLLRNTLCGGIEYDDGRDSTASGGTDANAGGDKSVHDDTFNDAFDDVKMRKRKKRKLKKKVANMVRDMSDKKPVAEYTGFLVKDFLDCTGYKFAKILTKEDPLPLPSDVRSATRYWVPFDGAQGPAAPCPAGGCKAYPYNPPKVNNVPWVNSLVAARGNVPAQKMWFYFPHVRDPLYAFKYFEYADSSRIGKRGIELLTCYSDPNDCYATIAGVLTKIPCCYEKKPDNTWGPGPFCDGPVTVGDGTGNVPESGYNDRLFVKSFCGKGKVVCEYHADKWSAGQRYSFYQMLVNYVKPRPGEEEEEVDYGVDETEEDYTVSSMGFYSGSNDIGMTDKDVANWRIWNNMGPNQSFTPPTVVQFEMTQMWKQCEGKCESRRDEFRAKLVLAFSQNGYVIGGCKSSDADNVVIEEDLDLLVDEIVERCKLQCPITTYKIETAACRRINMEPDKIGYTQQYVEIEYGVGGCTGGCPSNVPNCQDSDCGTNSDRPGECPEQNVLSRCEQKKWNQVMSWDFEIDMPSKLSLPTPGSRKFDCVANPNMADYTDVSSSLNTGVPDMYNFKSTKTVSPAVQINLSLPGKN